MHQYEYNGPVMHFDECIQGHWKAETTAPSEAKARNNLTYRYKRENGYLPNCRITLPGKLYLND